MILMNNRYNRNCSFTGTNGAVSTSGIVMSLLGGLVVGIGHYLTLLMFVSSPVMISAPAQWPIIIVGAVGGLLGSLIDSVIGATMQFSGMELGGSSILVISLSTFGLMPCCCVASQLLGSYPLK